MKLYTFNFLHIDLKHFIQIIKYKNVKNVICAHARLYTKQNN